MLIECKECNKKISDTAKTCPNCGYGVPKKENSFLQLIGVVILIIISIPIFNTLIYEIMHSSDFSFLNGSFRGFN